MGLPRAHVEHLKKHGGLWRQYKSVMHLLKGSSSHEIISRVPPLELLNMIIHKKDDPFIAQHALDILAQMAAHSTPFASRFPDLQTIPLITYYK